MAMNVNIGCTIENQQLADYRLPLFLSYPIKRRFIACAPLLGPVTLSPYLDGIEHVTVGGETGRAARECNYDWVLDIREQCVQAGVPFWFKNTGTLFRRDGTIFIACTCHIPHLTFLFQFGNQAFPIQLVHYDFMEVASAPLIHELLHQTT